MQTRRALLSGGVALASLGMAPAERALLLGGATTAPSLDLNFVQTPTLDSRITFTRASSATYFDSTNTLQSASSNIARFDYGPTSTTPLGLLIEEARTNGIRNNTMVGAVAGSPGTMPTNWSTANNTGVSIAVIGTGVENGISYIDMAYTGTASGAGVVGVTFESNTAISATTGQVWTASTYYRLVGGSLSNFTSLSFGMQEDTAGGAVVVTGTSVVTPPTSASLATQRGTYTRTLSGGGTVAAVTLWLRFNVTAAGAVNVTLRIGLPQLELGGFATSAIQTSGAAATRAADVASMPAGSWFAGATAPGTMEAEYLPEYAGAAASANFALSLDNGSATDRYALRSKAASGSVAAAVISSASSDTASGTLLTDVIGTTSKLALTWSGGTSQNSVGNAGTVQATTSVAPTSSLTTLGFGNTAAASYLNGWLRRASYWPRMMSNTELQQTTM